MNQEFLKNTLLFADLTEDELVEIILLGQQRPFEKDSVIFEEGDPGDSLYLIVEGGVRISLIRSSGEEALAILRAPDIFGEMTLFDFQPRSAHAIAHEDCSLFEISNTALLNLFKENKEIGYKFLWSFGKTLTTRLRNTNDKFNVMMAMANFC